MITLPRMPDLARAAGAFDSDPATGQTAVERQIAVVIAQHHELAAESAVDQQSADASGRAEKRRRRAEVALCRDEAGHPPPSLRIELMKIAPADDPAG